MIRLVDLAVVAVLAPAAALAAHDAMRTCGARPAVVAELESRYGETRRAFGVVSTGHLMEMFADSDDGSWTIIETLQAGRACIVGHGEAFEAEPSLARPGEAL